MKIYLDNCCFNRPFDDQSQIRIKLEAEAKLKIQSDIQDSKFELVWSYILEAENMENPFEERKRPILEWKRHSIVIIKEKGTILEEARKLNQIGLSSKDALHIACAISAGCKYFITTDDRIINKQILIEELILTDPIGFIKEVYDDN
jgi:predicted nucleic acid-binding protein